MRVLLAALLTLLHPLLATLATVRVEAQAAKEHDTFEVATGQSSIGPASPANSI